MTEREALPPLPTPIDGPAHSTYTPEDMLAYGRTVWQASRQQALTEAATEAESWRGGKLLLNAGEMSAQELRTCRAVVGGIGRAIRGLSHPTGGKE